MTARVQRGHFRRANQMNMKLKAFLVLTALALACIPQAGAQNYNHTTGTVVAWGSGAVVPANLTNVTAIASGENENGALRSDGTFVAWLFGGGYDTNPYLANFTNIIAIASSEDHCLALKSDGTVLTYGGPTVPTNLSGVIGISAGGGTPASDFLLIQEFSLALKSDGTIAAWGDNTYGQTNVPANATNVTAIAAGFYHSLALKSDGTVVAWGAGLTNNPSDGDQDCGQSIVPTNLTNVTAIAAGYYHSLAVKSDGTVVAWGANVYGETNVPINLTNVISVAAGLFQSLALKSDGTVVAWGGIHSPGHTNSVAIVPTNLNGVIAIAASEGQSLALVAPRVLQIQWSGSNVVVAWPLSPTNVVLQITTDVTTSNSWMTVTNAPSIVNVLNIVTNPITASQGFYRLFQSQ
jgi:hypothetical protein